MRAGIVAVVAVLGVAVSAGSAAAATPYYQTLSVSSGSNTDGVWGSFVAPNGSVVSNSDLDAEVGTTYSFVWMNGALVSPTPTDDVGCWSNCNTEVTGINASGQISGTADPTGIDQAFREDETTHTVTFLRSGSEAYGINAAGQMVGGYRNASGQERAFLWDGTTFHDLGTLGGAGAVATSTPATNQAVGCAQTASGVWHPFVYKNGTMRDLGLPPGFSQACAYSSDQNGEIVGGEDVGPWEIPSNWNGQPLTVGGHACRAWYRSSTGTYTTIHGPTGTACIVANHVALGGQLIGTYQTTGGSSHPFTWQAGTFHTIGLANVPFDHFIIAGGPESSGPLSRVDQGWGNNLHGQLVITADNTTNTRFLPPTWALLLTPITVDDETSPAITYTGSWNRTSWSGAFGGYTNESEAPGATAKLTFTGKSVSLIGPRAGDLGSADIYVDNTLVANVTENLATLNSQTRQRIFQLTWPTASKHTLKIVATSPYFELDAITTAQR
jgi:probable HAF family extracellular repeat protein